jgi:hypothetical protein
MIGLKALTNKTNNNYLIYYRLIKTVLTDFQFILIKITMQHTVIQDIPG